MRFVLGIDEAGRGPLAGPVAVGVVAVPEGFNVEKEFPGVKDSKKLSAGKREEIFEMLKKRAEQGEVRYAIELEPAEAIDKEGITACVRRAVTRGINSLAPDAALARVLLDGLLKAPPEYAQETIVGGDELVPLISLASIAAKVTRDRLMTEFAHTYPSYFFEKHKGYGTALHYQALAEHGPSPIHRRSYCIDLTKQLGYNAEMSATLQTNPALFEVPMALSQQSPRALAVGRHPATPQALQIGQFACVGLDGTKCEHAHGIVVAGCALEVECLWDAEQKPAAKTRVCERRLSHR